MVWSNVKGRPFRNLALLLCFAFIAGSILSANILVVGIDHSIQMGVDRLGADMMVVPSGSITRSEEAILTGQPSTFTFSSEVYDRILEVDGVSKASPLIFIATLANQACCSVNLQLIGFNQTLDFTVHPWLHNHQDSTLYNGSCCSGPVVISNSTSNSTDPATDDLSVLSLDRDEIIVGSDVAGGIGDQLTFYGHVFTIAGKLDRTGMGMDHSVFIRDADAYVMAAESPTKAVETLAIPNGTISAVLIRLEPGADPALVMERISEVLPQVGIVVANDLKMSVSSRISEAVDPLWLSSSIIAVASILLMATATFLTVNDRRSEIGILRTMGASRKFIVRLVLTETAALAVIGSLIGALISYLLLNGFLPAIMTDLDIPFLWPSFATVLGQVGSVCLLALIIGAAASIYPAYLAGRIDPYAAIRSME